MTFFRRTRIRSRIALATSLFWLLALASSWANACVLQDRQTHLHAPARAGAPDTVTVMTRHVDATPALGDDAASATSVCLEVGDAATQTSVQPNQGVNLSDILAGPPTSPAWTLAVLSLHVAATQFAAAPSPRAAVPLRTLLSRLVL